MSQMLLIGVKGRQHRRQKSQGGDDDQQRQGHHRRLVLPQLAPTVLQKGKSPRQLRLRLGRGRGRGDEGGIRNQNFCFAHACPSTLTRGSIS